MPALAPQSGLRQSSWQSPNDDLGRSGTEPQPESGGSTNPRADTQKAGPEGPALRYVRMVGRIGIEPMTLGLRVRSIVHSSRPTRRPLYRHCHVPVRWSRDITLLRLLEAPLARIRVLDVGRPDHSKAGDLGHNRFTQTDSAYRCRPRNAYPADLRAPCSRFVASCPVRPSRQPYQFGSSH